MSPREHRIAVLQLAHGASNYLRALLNLFEVMTDDEYDEYIRRLDERAANRATD